MPQLLKPNNATDPLLNFGNSDPRLIARHKIYCKSKINIVFGHISVSFDANAFFFNPESTTTSSVIFGTPIQN